MKLINSKKGFISLTIVIIVLGIFISGVYAGYMNITSFKQEAVHNGHAKFIVDEKGIVSFEWLATQTIELKGEKIK